MRLTSGIRMHAEPAARRIEAIICIPYRPYPSAQREPPRSPNICRPVNAMKGELRVVMARHSTGDLDRGNNMHSVPPIPERTTRTAQIAEYLQTRQRHEGRIARGYGAPLNR